MAASLNNLIGASVAFSILSFLIVIFLGIVGVLYLENLPAAIADHKARLAAEAYPKVNASRCNDGNACTVDLLYPQNYCDYKMASNGTACTSACYVDETVTACNGLGTCSSDDYTTCASYCETPDGHIWGGDCNNTALFPLWPYFLLPGDYLDTADETGGADDANAPYCFASQCVQVAVMATLEQFPDDGGYDEWAGVLTQCSDLLDNTTATVAAGCVESTHFEIDSNFLQKYIQVVEGSPFDNYTLRACVFRYTCGRFNTSAFTDPANLGKRAVGMTTSYLDPLDHLIPAANAHAVLGGPAGTALMAERVLARVDNAMRRMQDRPETSQPYQKRVFVV